MISKKYNYFDKIGHVGGVPNLGCPASTQNRPERLVGATRLVNKLEKHQLGCLGTHRSRLSSTRKQFWVLPTLTLWEWILAESCLSTWSKFSASQTYVSRDMKKRWKSARDNPNSWLSTRGIVLKHSDLGSNSLWAKLSGSNFEKCAQEYKGFLMYSMLYGILWSQNRKWLIFDEPNGTLSVHSSKETEKQGPFSQK